MKSYPVDLPETIYIALLLWGIVVFVVWYFYRHAHRKYRVGFRTVFSIVSALFFFAIALEWFNSRPPFDPIRIAIFPFKTTSDNGERLSWEGLALSGLIAHNLDMAFARTRYLAYQPDWIWRTAAKDSLQYEAYRRTLARRLNADFIIDGSITVEEMTYSVSFTIDILDSAGGIDSEPSQITGTTLPDLSEVITAGLLTSLGELPSNVKPLARFCCESQVAAHFRGLLAFLQGDLAQAQSQVSHAVARDSSFVPSLDLLATILIQRGIAYKASRTDALPVFRHAKHILEQAARADSTWPETQRLFGELYLTNERWNDAERYLRKSLEHEPVQPAVYLNLARLRPERYRELGFNDESSLYKSALFIYPGLAEGWFRLAAFYAAKNNQSQAFACLEQWLGINPVHIEGLMALGKLSLDNARFAQAFDIYERVLQLQPENGDVYYNLGVVSYNLGELDQAANFFTRAVEMSDHLDSRLYLAYICEKQGRIEDAIAHLRARIKGRVGEDDRFADQARQRLWEIMHRENTPDSSAELP